MAYSRLGFYSPCKFCESPRIWPLSYKWYMAHAKTWGDGLNIVITENDFDRMANHSRCSRKYGSRSGYLGDLKERLDVEGGRKNWKGIKNRYNEMYVPGLERNV